MPTRYARRASAIDEVLDFVKPPRLLCPVAGCPSAVTIPFGAEGAWWTVLLAAVDVGFANKPVHSLGPVWTGGVALDPGASSGPEGPSPADKVAEEAVLPSDCVDWSDGSPPSMGAFSKTAVERAVAFGLTFGSAGMIGTAGTAGTAAREAGLDGLACVGVVAIDIWGGCAELGVVGEVDVPFYDGWS